MLFNKLYAAQQIHVKGDLNTQLVFNVNLAL